MHSLMQDKGSVRKYLLKKRDDIPPEVRNVKNKMIYERLFSLSEFKKAGAIFFFASFRTEVDTLGMIKDSLTEGKRVMLPRVDTGLHVLALYEIRNMEELTPGYMGIPEPSVITEDRSRGVNDADVIIIPGAGFDMSGNRIGYGAGYYDILLSDLQKDVPLVAPAYEEQVVASLPAEPHDKKVRIIVTDRRIIKCVPFD